MPLNLTYGLRRSAAQAVPMALLLALALPAQAVPSYAEVQNDFS